MFGRKKKKEGLEKKFDKVYREINAIDEWDNPRKIEHYILDSCEQIVALTKQIQGEKTQGKILDSYMEDIEKIRGTSYEKRKEISETASKIVELEKAKEQYARSEKKISDEDFVLIQENEENVPSDIRRMQENEKYREKVKREMNLLEGEKGEASYEIEDNRKGAKLLKNTSVVLFFVFVITFLLFFYIRMTAETDVTMFFIVFLLAGAATGLLIFLKQQSLSRFRRRRIRQMNQTTQLLNVVRVKYASVTRALDMEREHYRVKSSRELNGRWENYIAAVREKEQYIADNDDLEYFSGKLMRILSPLDLYDRRIWLSQPGTLIRDSLLENVKSKLKTRRSRINAEIEENTKAVRSERDEITKLMREHDFYMPEILEMIATIDKISGLTPQSIY